MDHSEADMFDLGLQADLTMWLRSTTDRRRLLKLGALGLGLLLTRSTPGQALGAACGPAIPAETAGPYPADGSTASQQQLNVLLRTGIVRSDIRPSLNTGNTAPGIPCTVRLTLVNTNANCAPLSGYAVYAWHCTRDGLYSMYSSSIVNEDYLRGVQASNSSGVATFTTIFPGCYAGRWPHIHFEIYPSLATATGPANLLHTSQLAIPEAACAEAYTASGYASSAQNLSQISLASDNVFGDDGGVNQLASASGDPSNGYTLELTVGVPGPALNLDQQIFLPLLHQ